MEIQTQTIQKETQTKNVWIRMWGEKLHSPYSERRKWYVDSNYELDVLLKLIESKMKSLVYDATPWWESEEDEPPCKYCRKQIEISKKMRLPLDTWRTSFCLRHGILVNAMDLPLVDNKPRVVVFSDSKIYYATQSVKWFINIVLTNEEAVVRAYNYLNRKLFTFRYRNYDQDNSYSSSYSFISNIVSIKLEVLKHYLTCDIREDDPQIFFNGRLICTHSNNHG